MSAFSSQLRSEVPSGARVSKCPRSRARRISRQSQVPQERISERSEAIEVPKISCQEYIEVVKSVPQERISERMSEQREVIDVTEFSSLLCTLDQMLEVTKISC